MNAKNYMMEKINQAKTYNELMSLTIDYYFLTKMTDDLIFLFNSLESKIITPAQFKVMALDCLNR